MSLHYEAVRSFVLIAVRTFNGGAMGHVSAIPHLPYFEALARLDESTAEWRSTSAGLVTLRLVEQASDARAAGQALDLLHVASVEDAIDAMDSRDLTRGLLRSVLEAIREGGISVLPRLMAYAKAQQFRAAWTLAVATYEAVLAHPHALEQTDIAMAACLQRGYCLRMAGALAAAEDSYDEARRGAVAAGNIAVMLRADLGCSQLALHRGNLPVAQELLDQVIETAQGQLAGGSENSVMTDILARALLDRMQVAGRRGQRESAVVFGYRALEHAERPTLRDRILGDIGTVLGELGYKDAARDANLLVAATAEEQTVRWTATVNLLELAALDLNEPVFERYCAELSAVELPASLLAYFRLYRGEGYRRFGRYDRAERALAEAIRTAREHGVNEVAFRAEAALRELQSEHAPQRSAPAVDSEAVSLVARSITRMREAAGLGLA